MRYLFVCIYTIISIAITTAIMMKKNVYASRKKSW